jgi:hypothetical protein
MYHWRSECQKDGSPVRNFGKKEPQPVSIMQSTAGDHYHDTIKLNVTDTGHTVTSGAESAICAASA